AQRAHPVHATPVVSRFSSIPNSATAPRGPARTVRSAVLRGQPAPQPLAMSREKRPASFANRRASRNKSGRAVVDFVFVPPRQIVPEKLGALYAPGVPQANLRA